MALAAAWVVLLPLALWAPLEPLIARLGISGSQGLFPGALSALWWHVSLTHAVTTLLLFAASGPWLEARWGRPAFAGFFAVLAAVAIAADRLWYSEAPLPWLGPTPLLAGLAAAVTFLGWRSGLGVRIGWGTRTRDVVLPAVVLAPLWLLASIVLDAQAPLGGPVAAHGLGSGAAAAACGALVAVGLVWSGWEQRLRPIARATTGAHVKKALADAADARSAGRPEDAYDRLDRALAGNAGDAPLIAALWDVAGECQRRGQAADVGAQFVIREAGREELAAATEVWRKIAREANTTSLPLALRFSLADRLLAEGDGLAAAATLRGALQAGPATLTSGAALRIAEKVEALHGATAIEALRFALAHSDFDASKRSRLEAWIARIEASPERLDETELDEAELDAPAEAPVSHAPEPSAIDLDDLDVSASGDPLVVGTPEVENHEEEAPDDPGAVDLAADPGDSIPLELSETPIHASEDEAEDEGIDLDALGVDPDLLDGIAVEAHDLAELGDPGEVRFPAAKIVQVQVEGLQAGRVHFTTRKGDRSGLDVSKIQALAWIQIGSDPWLDALLNWNATDLEPLRIVRMSLAPAEGKPLAERLGALARALLDACEASPLTPLEGTPTAFPSLQRYQRDLLGVAEADASGGAADGREHA